MKFLLTRICRQKSAPCSSRLGMTPCTPGNIRTRELKDLFAAHLAEMVQALERNSLVELDRSEVRIVV